MYISSYKNVNIQEFRGYKRKLSPDGNNAKQYRHFRQPFSHYSVKLNKNLPYDPSIPLLDI